MQMANLRPDAGENGSTVRSPNQDPVIGQNFLFPVVRDRLWLLSEQINVLVPENKQNIKCQLGFTGFTCPYHFTVCRKKWRPNISDMCKSRTWWLCNQHLNIRAKCWIFVSVCFPLHICVHFIYSTCAFFLLYLVAMQNLGKLEPSHHGCISRRF